MTERAVPLLGDISLEYVQQAEYTLSTGFAATRIAGLPGELQQRNGRPSHHIYIRGLLFGESVQDELSKLQKAAADGQELTFAADIVTALELQKVVIAFLRVVEISGTPNYYSYELELIESPPIPPPAQVESFGGLGDFGVGDLGFDTDILGDISNLAGDIAGAVNDALDVIDQLGALANLGNLGSLGNFLEPVSRTKDNVVGVADNFQKAGQSLKELFS